MYYAFIAYDRPGHLAVRQNTREAHIAFLKSLGDTLVSAGPLLSPAGEMMGSLLILQSEDKVALERALQKDPYAEAGLFERSDLIAWNWVLGKPAE